MKNPISRIIIFLFIVHNLNLSPMVLADSVFKVANTPGAIGETDNLFLIQQSVFARPFYNDAFGKTDKHLSGSTQLGLIKDWSDSSFQLQHTWRFITPTFEEKFGSEELIKPVGRYADWVEMQGAWAKIYALNGEKIRVQVAAGIGDIGNHGARELHRAFHKLIGSSILGLNYDNQPLGNHGTYGLELGLISEDRLLWSAQFESLINIGLSHNEFMNDLYLNQNQVFKVSDRLLFGFETRIIRQLSSDGYKDQNLAWRFEAAAGMRWAWYRPSVKYVSPFLRNDQVGQLYVDLLAFVYEF